MASSASLPPSVMPCWKIVAGGGLPAKPTPPCTPRALLLKSVMLPMTADQFEMRWSAGFSLEKKESSDRVWRGPVPKIQETLSDNPSGWQEAQPDQPLSEALP